MVTYAVYLQPKGSFVSQIHSDTLFGAICWAIRTLYSAEELEKVLDGFSVQPKFILSSAFPYLRKDNQPIRFLPKPQLGELKSQIVKELAKEKAPTADAGSLDFKRAIIEVSEKLKEIKKVTYVSEQLFKEILLGQTNVKELYNRMNILGMLDSDIERIGDTLITTAERKCIDPNGELRRSAFVSESDVQRNQIDRIAGSTVEGLLFFEKQTFLKRNIAGLWFILKTDDLEFLKPALRYLADTGIGGERTVGKGQVEIPLNEIEKLELPQADDANCFVILSRYLPTDGECDFNAQPLGYTLLNWRGKHESMFPVSGQPIYKELVRVFTEGSILPFKERKEFYGKLESVGTLQGRTVWYNGLALPAFGKIGSEMR